MSFEEEFPSLKGFHEDPKNLLFSARQGYSKVFHERAITNYCVDKQRLQKAIEKWDISKNPNQILFNKIGFEKELEI